MRHVVLRGLLVAVLLAIVLSPPPPSGYTGPEPSGLSPDAAWNIDAVGAPAVWERTQGAGVTVAVLDSGVALDHPDLRAHIAGSVDCTGSRGDPQRCSGAGVDGNGHGTHVAGIIAVSPSDRGGLTGVAPEARILAVRVLDDGCLDTGCVALGTSDDVIGGIRWAVARGADVINLSLVSTGSTPVDDELRQAVLDAWAGGVIVVTAAGSGDPAVGLDDLPVVVVAGLDRTGRLGAYSRGVGDARWGIAAPGGQSGDTTESCARTGEPVGILSTWWSAEEGVGYGCLSGTSMAAPHVPGAAALLRSMGLPPEEVVRRLLDSATDLGTPGADRFYGSGALDVARAVDPEAAPTRGTERFTTAAKPSAAVRSPDVTAVTDDGGQGGVPVLVLMVVALAVAVLVGRALAGRPAADDPPRR